MTLNSISGRGIIAPSGNLTLNKENNTMAKKEEKTVKVLFIRNTFMDGELKQPGDSMDCKEGMSRMLLASKKAYKYDSDDAKSYMKNAKKPLTSEEKEAKKKADAEAKAKAEAEKNKNP